jgi:prophage antirepressor-like protein
MDPKRSLVKEFEGSPVTTIEFRGRPVWVAREIGRALGYEDEGRQFVKNVTDEWSAELEPDTDRIVVEGDDLQDLKELVGDSPTSPVGLRTTSLTLLTESGLHLALMLSRKPAGRRLRRWLATEVLPAIARTGGYRGQLAGGGGRGPRVGAAPDDRQRRLALREVSAIVHGARERRMRARDLLEIAKRLRRQADGRDRALLARAMDLEGEAADLLRSAEQDPVVGGGGGGKALAPAAARYGPRAAAELPAPPRVRPELTDRDLKKLLRFLRVWWRQTTPSRRGWLLVELGRMLPGYERIRTGKPPEPERFLEIRGTGSSANRTWYLHDLGPDGTEHVREVAGDDLFDLVAELVFDPDGEVRARAVPAGRRKGGRLLVLEPMHPKAAAIAGNDLDGRK